MKYFIISIFIAILFAALLFTAKQKEGFLNEYCQTYTDCTSCAKASNQMNVINSSFRCKSESEPSEPPESDIQLDKQFALYKDRIKNKIPPPNAYTADKIKYSNEDVVSNANNVRNDIQNLNIGLPGIISSSVENNIKPMVKGILAENYYIQGFEDMRYFK